MGVRALLRLDTAVRVELRGAGPVLQPLLEDPAVTDVLVNGTAGVWVDRGAGLERVAADATFADAAAVRALATRLAAACGQRLDDASPVVDGSLPDGTRLHAVLPPLSAGGTLISLRTHRARSFTLAELVGAARCRRRVAPVLRALVAGRANVLVSGATGCGKTTLLATLLSLVGPHERIVCIEEAAELRPDHPHVVHLQTRRANVQQVGGGAAERARARGDADAPRPARPRRVPRPGGPRRPRGAQHRARRRVGHRARQHLGRRARPARRARRARGHGRRDGGRPGGQRPRRGRPPAPRRRGAPARRDRGAGPARRRAACDPALVVERGEARAGPGWPRLAGRLAGWLPQEAARSLTPPPPADPPRPRARGARPHGRHAAGPP